MINNKYRDFDSFIPKECGWPLHGKDNNLRGALRHTTERGGTRMSTKLMKGYRISATAEAISMFWKDIEFGITGSSPLRELAGGKRTTPKGKGFQTINEILVDSGDSFLEKYSVLTQKFNLLHAYVNPATTKVRTFRSALDTKLELLGANVDISGMKVLTSQEVKDLNSEMHDLAPGKLFRLKVTVTRVEDYPFPKSKPVVGTELYAHSKVALSRSFFEIDELESFVEGTLKPILIGTSLYQEPIMPKRTLTQSTIIRDDKGKVKLVTSKVRTGGGTIPLRNKEELQRAENQTTLSEKIVLRKSNAFG